MYTSWPWRVPSSYTARIEEPAVPMICENAGVMGLCFECVHAEEHEQLPDCDNDKKCSCMPVCLETTLTTDEEVEARR